MRNLAALDAGLRDEDATSSLVVSVNAKVAHWLVAHIMKSDKQFGTFMGAGGAAPAALTALHVRDNNGI
jgi:hemerythrin